MSGPELNEKQLDELRELGNVGAGQASQYISDIVGKKVDIGVPEVAIVDFDGDAAERLSDILGVPSSDQLMTVFTPTTEPGGGVTFSFTQQNYMSFLEMTPDDVGDDFLELSGNVADKYLDGAGMLLGMDISNHESRLVSMPLNTLLIQIESSIVGTSDSTNALVINVDFSIEDDAEGVLTLFLEVDDVKSVVKAMEDQL